MRHHLKRMSRILALAALVTPTSAWAQDANFSGIPSVATARDGSQVVVVEANKARDWAMLIELELIGDPLTYYYSLKPQANSRGMEIQGYVPNELIRDRALAVSRKICPMPVADGMIVQKSMSVPLPGPQPANMLNAIRDRLRQANPQQCEHVEAQINANGQVVLTGHVLNLVDKLQFSRALRGLPGCTGVINDLVVPQVVTQDSLPRASYRHGIVLAATTLPSAAGSVVRQATKAEPQSVEPALAPVAIPVVQKPTPTPQVLNPVPSTLPLPPAPKVQPAPLAQPAQPAETIVVPPHSDIAGGLLPPPPVTPVAGTMTREIAERDGAPVLVRFEELARKPAPTRLAETPAATTPSEFQPTPPHAAPAPAPAPGSDGKPRASAADEGAPSPSSRGQQALKSKLKSALGKEVKEVDLVFDKPGSVKVTLKVTRDADHTRIVTQLVQMPEMSPYEVSVGFQVMK